MRSAWLLLDIANVHANAANRVAELDTLARAANLPPITGEVPVR